MCPDTSDVPIKINANCCFVSYDVNCSRLESKCWFLTRYKYWCKCCVYYDKMAIVPGWLYALKLRYASICKAISSTSETLYSLSILLNIHAFKIVVCHVKNVSHDKNIWFLDFSCLQQSLSCAKLSPLLLRSTGKQHRFIITYNLANVISCWVNNSAFVVTQRRDTVLI